MFVHYLLYVFLIYSLHNFILYSTHAHATSKIRELGLGMRLINTLIGQLGEVYELE